MNKRRNNSTWIEQALLKQAQRLNILLHPELARLKTEQEREEALGAVHLAYSRKWWYPVSIITTLLGGIALGVFAAELVQRLGLLSFVPGFLVRAAMTLGGLAASLVVAGYFYRARNRRELRRILSERGIAICVACGYDLTLNVSGKCPECGTKIKPNSS